MPTLKKKIKILVVDDERDVCKFVRSIFKKKGFITYGAFSGRKALMVAKKAKPDIALIDLYLLRGIDGIETVKKLKEIVPTCLSAMMTWDTSKEKIKLAKKVGAAYYLPKPLTVKGLDKTVKKLARKINKGDSRRG